jgi:hypothetical protein
MQSPAPSRELRRRIVLAIVYGLLLTQLAPAKAAAIQLYVTIRRSWLDQNLSGLLGLRLLT